MLQLTVLKVINQNAPITAIEYHPITAEQNCSRGDAISNKLIAWRWPAISSVGISITYSISSWDDLIGSCARKGAIRQNLNTWACMQAKQTVVWGLTGSIRLPVITSISWHPGSENMTIHIRINYMVDKGLCLASSVLNKMNILGYY